MWEREKWEVSTRSWTSQFMKCFSTIHRRLSSHLGDRELLECFISKSTELMYLLLIGIYFKKLTLVKGWRCLEKNQNAGSSINGEMLLVSFVLNNLQFLIWYHLIIGPVFSSDPIPIISCVIHCVSYALVILKLFIILLTHILFMVLWLERLPGPEQVCTGPAGSVWFLDLVQEIFHSTRPGDF